MEVHPSGLAWRRWGMILGAAIVTAGGLSYFFLVRDDASAEDSNGKARENRSGIKVDVILPKPGGIPRVVTQPGSVEPFLGAILYAKVFGQLKTLTVDIGSKVKKGDLLAEIYIPEREAKALRDKSRVEDAQAKVMQAESQKAEAEAEARAADASVVLATILVKVKTAFKH